METARVSRTKGVYVFMAKLGKIDLKGIEDSDISKLKEWVLKRAGGRPLQGAVVVADFGNILVVEADGLEKILFVIDDTLWCEMFDGEVSIHAIYLIVSCLNLPRLLN